MSASWHDDAVQKREESIPSVKLFASLLVPRKSAQPFTSNVMRLARSEVMEWLEPWYSTEMQDSSFHERFQKQLLLELPDGHELFGLPVRLIGRGDSDDSLFEILDGSGRVAVVHLTWAKVQERLPWPSTAIYKHLEAFIEKRMLPDHRAWIGE